MQKAEPHHQSMNTRGEREFAAKKDVNPKSKLCRKPNSIMHVRLDIEKSLHQHSYIHPQNSLIFLVETTPQACSMCKAGGWMLDNLRNERKRRKRKEKKSNNAC